MWRWQQPSQRSDRFASLTSSRSKACSSHRAAFAHLATPSVGDLQEAPPGSRSQSGRPEHLILTESQVQALEKAKADKEAEGEIETEHPGYLGAQDTYYVGTIKGVGRIYQQTFIDTYTKVAFAKLYDRKNALVAADLLNDQVLPFFEQVGVRLSRVLTDRGTEYCGVLEHHEYELYLAIEDIDHSKTKALTLH